MEKISEIKKEVSDKMAKSGLGKILATLFLAFLGYFALTEKGIIAEAEKLARNPEIVESLFSYIAIGVTVIVIVLIVRFFILGSKKNKQD